MHTLAATSSNSTGSPRSPARHPLSHAGWMLKQGGDYFGMWRKRHFELRGRDLLYAKTAGGKKLGCMPVFGAFVQRTDPAQGGIAVSGQQLPRTYQLMAETPDEADLWVMRLAEKGATVLPPSLQADRQDGSVPMPLQIVMNEQRDRRQEITEMWQIRLSSLERCFEVLLGGGKGLPYAQGAVTGARHGMILGEVALGRATSDRPSFQEFVDHADELETVASTPRATSPLLSPQLTRCASFRTCASDDELEDASSVLITASRAVKRVASMRKPRDEDLLLGPRNATCVFDPAAAPRRKLPANLAAGLGQGPAPSRVMSRWDFLKDPADIDYLAQGGALFACCASPGNVLRDVECGMIAQYIDFTSFDDELRDNGVVKVDMGNVADLADHIFLLSKAQFLLPPNVEAGFFTPSSYASTVFQKAIAPSGVRVFSSGQIKDRDGRRYLGDDTFCVKKEVIPWVFSITTQFKVSVLSAHQLKIAEVLADGLPLQYGLLFERTKQDRGQDATKKAKQVLLFHHLEGGGLLVTHVCFSIFTHLPSVAQKLIDKIGARGASETAESTQKMRIFFANK
eukprot:TRINITY_DN30701_c0_g1_i1.p1 TRINITY_DN30701_c0_g1~~TRINITY_DN30701_c0_g1_i1.p1  ORF type:complete len:570 (+),score=168.22 TRINITY_DN30701_c0_g1_i1:57-1766(+)